MLLSSLVRHMAKSSESSLVEGEVQQTYAEYTVQRKTHEKVDLHSTIHKQQHLMSTDRLPDVASLEFARGTYRPPCQ